MRGRTIKQFLVLGSRTKRGVALNEEIALNEVVRRNLSKAFLGSSVQMKHVMSEKKFVQYRFME